MDRDDRGIDSNCRYRSRLPFVELGWGQSATVRTCVDGAAVGGIGAAAHTLSTGGGDHVIWSHSCSDGSNETHGLSRPRDRRSHSSGSGQHDSSRAHGSGNASSPKARYDRRHVQHCYNSSSGRTGRSSGRGSPSGGGNRLGGTCTFERAAPLVGGILREKSNGFWDGIPSCGAASFVGFVSGSALASEHVVGDSSNSTTSDGGFHRALGENSKMARVRGCRHLCWDARDRAYPVKLFGSRTFGRGRGRAHSHDDSTYSADVALDADVEHSFMQRRRPLSSGSHGLVDHCMAAALRHQRESAHVVESTQSNSSACPSRRRRTHDDFCQTSVVRPHRRRRTLQMHRMSRLIASVPSDGDSTDSGDAVRGNRRTPFADKFPLSHCNHIVMYGRHATGCRRSVSAHTLELRLAACGLDRSREICKTSDSDSGTARGIDPVEPSNSCLGASLLSCHRDDRRGTSDDGGGGGGCGATSSSAALRPSVWLASDEKLVTCPVEAPFSLTLASLPNSSLEGALRPTRGRARSDENDDDTSTTGSTQSTVSELAFSSPREELNSKQQEHNRALHLDTHVWYCSRSDDSSDSSRSSATRDAMSSKQSSVGQRSARHTLTSADAFGATRTDPEIALADLNSGGQRLLRGSRDHIIWDSDGSVGL